MIDDKKEEAEARNPRRKGVVTLVRQAQTL